MRTASSSHAHAPVSSLSGDYPLECWFFQSELDVLSLLQKWEGASSDELLRSARSFIERPGARYQPLPLQRQLAQLHPARHAAVATQAQTLQKTQFQRAGTLLLAVNDTFDAILRETYQTGRAPSDWHARLTGAIRSCEEAYDAAASPPSKWIRIARWVRTILLNTWYVQRADALVVSQERALQGTLWKGSTPMTAADLQFSKAATACALFAFDLAQWKLSGLSASLVHSVAQSVIPRFGNELCQSCVQWSAVLIVDSQLNSRSLGGTAAVYLVVIGAAKCAQTGVNWVYRDKTHPTYPLVHTLTQLAAFSGAANYLAPYALQEWNAIWLQPNEILGDAALCKTHPIRCRRAAYAALQLDEAASLEEIRHAYRRETKLLHPDHSSGDRAAFERILRAKQLLST